MENTPLGSPGIQICKVLDQWNKITLKKQALTSKKIQEKLSKLRFFWAEVPPALSLSLSKVQPLWSQL